MWTPLPKNLLPLVLRLNKPQTTRLPNNVSPAVNTDKC